MSKKITELTALTTPAATDLVAVVDMSGTPTTKKSTLAQLATALTLTISQITGLAADLATRALAAVTLTAGAGLTGGGDLSSNRTFTIGAGTGITVNADDIAVNYGTTAVTACVGNDSRLSDSRTPTAHATSHKSGGSDVIKLDELATPADSTTLNATATEHGLLKKLSSLTSEFMRGDGTWNPVAGEDLTTSDVTTVNASTSKHGFLLKATAPASGVRNVVAIDNGELVYKNTPLVDSTNPAALGAVAPGTSLIAARRDHVHANPAIDTLAAATDITTLDVSTSAHGLTPKLPNDATKFLNGVGGYTVPPGSGGASQAFALTAASFRG